ncbi:Hypothetical_protein [Hexamita inflata]|uniref:Hypothetical_protein n=1 Tax=Hexamita inflata TaxID=28002 RepID=A0AA86P8R2_9EUKA|nr:Hypothetical protein HINF_LOCUS20678 [Hexamita inflata]
MNCAYISQNVNIANIQDCKFKLVSYNLNEYTLFYKVNSKLAIKSILINFYYVISGLSSECNALLSLSKLNIKGNIDGSQLTVFYGISKELNSQVNLYQSSIQIDYDDLQAFYGFSYLSVSKFVLNETELSVNGSQTEVFFGIAHQLGSSQIENSFFNFQITKLRTVPSVFKYLLRRVTHQLKFKLDLFQQIISLYPAPQLVTKSTDLFTKLKLLLSLIVLFSLW